MSIKKQSSTEDIKKKIERTRRLKKAFLFHLATFLLVNAMLLLINLVFSPKDLWIIYPFFGWLIIIVLHGVGYGLIVRDVRSGGKKGIIVHTSLYSSVIFYLFIINFMTLPTYLWAFYPGGFWGVALLFHTIIYGIYLKDIEPKELKKKKAPHTKKRPPFLDKAQARIKRSKLLSAITGGMTETTEEKSTVKAPNIKAQKTRGSIKPKKGKTSTKAIDLSEKEKKELEKTESEVDVEEKEIMCIVHKGTIDGTVYICPNCKTYYCLKCANALKEKNEKCWSCDNEINP